MCEARDAVVARIESGDAGALSLLLESYRGEMTEDINRRLPPHLRGDISEDLVQDVFASVLPSLSTFEWRGPEAFAGWLCIAVNGRFNDWCRRINRLRRDYRRIDTSADAAEPADSDTPLRRAVRGERDRILHRVLNEVLTAEQAEAIRLRYVEHLSVNDTAAVLDCTPAAVKMRCQRAMEEMREALGRTSNFLSSR